MGIFQFCFVAVFVATINDFIQKTEGFTEITVYNKQPKESFLSPYECLDRQGVYTCVDIPKVIPPNITSVIVTNFVGLSFSNKFSDSTWNQVKSLRITAPSVFTLSAKTFKGLMDLKELSIILSSVEEFSPDSFSGLENLLKLELLGMAYAWGTTILSALVSPGSLPRLQEITFNPGVLEHPPLMRVPHNFTEAFLMKPLKSINVSNTLVSGRLLDAIKGVLSNIDTLNISGCTLIPSGSVTFDYRSEIKAQSNIATKPILQTLDMSRSSSPPFPFVTLKQDDQNSDKLRKTVTLKPFMMLIENFYTDNIIKKDSELVASYDYRDHPLFWKILSFRANNIVIINCTWLFNENNNLSFIDVSDNKIEYISPGFASSFIHLKKINLSRNKLYLMQHLPELKNGLKTLGELISLDVSFNNISFIPPNMFDRNDNLEELNLRSNALTTIMFDLDNLQSLRTLDLRNNRIHFIEGGDLSRLQKYLYTNPFRSKTFKLLLEGNPISCACRGLDFIQFLANFTLSGNDTRVYSCTYKRQMIRIDKSAVEKCHYLCQRKTIIVASVSGSVSFVAVVLGLGCFFVKLRKKLKETNLEDEFRKEFNDRQLPERYITFMAYSTLNERIVRGHVLDPLHRELRERLGTNREIISTGYNFRPGFHITEETYRVIQLSRVFIAVVSDEFCKSNFCVAELHEACTQRKPVILVFIGDVDEGDMSPYLREVFRRRARAKLIINPKGAVELIPGIESICQSVISLAVQNEV